MADPVELKEEEVAPDEGVPVEVPPAYMDSQYDWVENEVHGHWLANALPGKVVGHVLSKIPANSPEDHVVNVVRRAYRAHQNRPETK